MTTQFDSNAIHNMVKQAYKSPFATEAVKFALVSAWKAFKQAERMEIALAEVVKSNPTLKQAMTLQSAVTIAQKAGAYRQIESACNKVEKNTHKDNTAQAVKLAANLWKVEQAEKRAQREAIKRENAEAKRIARAKLTMEAYKRVMGK